MTNLLCPSDIITKNTEHFLPVSGSAIDRSLIYLYPEFSRKADIGI